MGKTQQGRALYVAGAIKDSQAFIAIVFHFQCLGANLADAFLAMFVSQYHFYVIGVGAEAGVTFVSFQGDGPALFFRGFCL